MFCPASLVCAPVVQEQNVGEHEKDSRRHRDVPCDGDDTRDLNHDIGHSDDERSASSPVNGCFSVCLCARLVKYGQKFGFGTNFLKPTRFSVAMNTDARSSWAGGDTGLG
jgi:hypothetical protein